MSRVGVARAAALARSAHPGPTVAVTVVATVLGIAAGLEPWRTAVLAAAVLLDQVSVGVSNDWLDAPRDAAAGRRDKPVALGMVPIATARSVAIVAAVASLAATVPLGGWALLAHLVVLGGGWAYNAGLKGSPISVLPYLVSFGALPVLASAAGSPPQVAEPWTVAAGAALGVAAHFANVLPDLGDDAATGVRGLPHRLGPRISGVVIAIALVAAAVSVGFGPGVTRIGAAGMIAVGGIAVAIVVLVLRDRLGRALFRLIIVAAIIEVVLLAVTRSP